MTKHKFEAINAESAVKIIIHETHSPLEKIEGILRFLLDYPDKVGELNEEQTKWLQIAQRNTHGLIELMESAKEWRTENIR